MRGRFYCGIKEDLGPREAMIHGMRKVSRMRTFEHEAHALINKCSQIVFAMTVVLSLMNLDVAGLLVQEFIIKLNI